MAFRLWHEDAWTPSYHCVGEYFCEDLFIGLFCGSLVVSCINVYIHICIYIYIYSQTNTHTHTPVHRSLLWVSCRILSFTYVSFHICFAISVYACVCVCVCVLVCEDLFKRIVCGSLLWVSCHIYTSLLTRVVPICVFVCVCQQ